jgi:hypothetical protein
MDAYLIRSNIDNLTTTFDLAAPMLKRFELSPFLSSNNSKKRENSTNQLRFRKPKLLAAPDSTQNNPLNTCVQYATHHSVHIGTDLCARVRAQRAPSPMYVARTAWTADYRIFAVFET